MLGPSKRLVYISKLLCNTYW